MSETEWTLKVRLADFQRCPKNLLAQRTTVTLWAQRASINFLFLLLPTRVHLLHPHPSITWAVVLYNIFFSSQLY